MQVTIITIVIGTFVTITKGLLKGLEDLELGGRVETIQTTASLRTPRILRKVLENWEDLLSLRLQWKTISWHWWKNSNRWIIIIIIIIIIIATITKCLVQRLEDLQIKEGVVTIKTTALLRSARILKRVFETKGYCLSDSYACLEKISKEKNNVRLISFFVDPKTFQQSPHHTMSYIIIKHLHFPL